jgi:hypothetical protein
MKNFNRIDLFLLAISTSLMSWVHYYTVFFFAGELLYFFVMRDRDLSNYISKWWKALLPIFVSGTLAIIYMAVQMSRTAQLAFGRPDGMDLLTAYYGSFFYYASNLTGYNWGWLLALASLGFLIWVFYSIYRYLYISGVKDRNELKIAYILLGIAVATPFLGWVLGQFIHAYSPRFFIFTAWALLLLLSRAILMMKRKWLVFLIVGCILAAQLYVFYNFSMANIDKSFDFIKDGDTFVHEATYTYLPFKYYEKEYSKNISNNIIVEMTKGQYASVGGDAADKEEEWWGNISSGNWSWSWFYWGIIQTEGDVYVITEINRPVLMIEDCEWEQIVNVTWDFTMAKVISCNFTT